MDGKVVQETGETTVDAKACRRFIRCGLWLRAIRSGFAQFFSNENVALPFGNEDPKLYHSGGEAQNTKCILAA